MQFTNMQRGAAEQITAQFFVPPGANEWSSDLTGGTRGMNLKGMCVSLLLSQAGFETATNRLGTMAVLGKTGIPSHKASVLGVMLSDMVLGVDNLDNTWVTTLLYGPCERILTPGGGAVSTADIVLALTGSTSGLVVGLTATELDAPRPLTGLVEIKFKGSPIDNLETALINLDGTLQTAGTAADSQWFVQPGFNASASIVPASGSVIGWHYQSDVEAIPEEILNNRVTGPNSTVDDYRQVRGFVACMGTSAGRA